MPSGIAEPRETIASIRPGRWFLAGWVFVECSGLIAATALGMHDWVLYGQPASSAAKIEAWNVGRAIGLPVAMLLPILTRPGIPLAGLERVKHFLEALLGGLTQLLVHTLESEGELQWSGFGPAIYCCAALAVLFGLPLVRVFNPTLGLNFAASIYGRIAAAFLAGAVFGGMTQLAADLLWSARTAAPLGSEKFGIAPIATAMASGAWGAAVADPLLAPSRWALPSARGRSWIATFVGAALLLVLGYGYLFPNDDRDITFSSLQACAFMMPPIVAPLIAWRLPVIPTRKVRLLIAVLLGSVASSLLAIVLVEIRVSNGLSHEIDKLPFVLSQLFASASAVGAISLVGLDWPRRASSDISVDVIPSP